MADEPSSSSAARSDPTEASPILPASDVPLSKPASAGSEAPASHRGTAHLGSIDHYIHSIGRYHVHLTAILTFLICATYLTVTVALDRQSLLQNISYLAGNQMVRMHHLSDQTRAILNAAEAPAKAPIVLPPMMDIARHDIADIRARGRELERLHRELAANILERLSSQNDTIERERYALVNRIASFLDRVEAFLTTSPDELQQRYRYAGPIELTTDTLLSRQFEDVIRDARDRSNIGIAATATFTAWILLLMAATLVIISLFLFRPLLRKLKAEHDKSISIEDRLATLTYTDPLTGLVNRAAFKAALGDEFTLHAASGAGFALLIVDLDHFKSINDSYGQAAGDAVLGRVATVLRRSFPTARSIARLGGDEFAVLIPDVSEPADVERTAEDAAAVIAQPFDCGGAQIQVSASIGGALAPQHARDDAGLLRLADLALYTAKAKRNTTVLFSESSLANRLEQNRMTAALAQAADRDEFVVFYQPKIQLTTGRSVGFEALVRWRHPELGILPPARFLHLLDTPQLIGAMSRAVIDSAGRDLRAWIDAGFTPGAVAINLPETLLIGPDGWQMLAETIRKYGLRYHDFAVEVTEDVFLTRKSDEILANVIRFRACGMSISLDDFGTGFASLVHLRDFPFDELKIDKSFIAGIGRDRRSEQIIMAVLELSRKLGKRSVAEGIETTEQLEFLKAAGCEIGQGYLFARPEPVADVTNRLRRTDLPSDEANSPRVRKAAV
ncbi:MAG: EAL domain-containing protein [Ancalomicrobiaceae bacterium]|nr:EAL domain-containing protein [Ancalomicrobiaceae bacterium]